MSIGIDEQETCIGWSRTDDACKVYTSDTTVMTQLDKLAATSPAWEVVETHRLRGGELVGKTYKTNKRLISFRKDFRRAKDAGREELAARMAVVRDAKRNKADSEPA